MDEVRDDLADKVFNTPYRSLSAWGQQQIDKMAAKVGKVNAPHNITLRPVDDPATLLRDNERLASANESLRQENLDLWDENQQMRMELEELKEELNFPDSSL